MDGMQTPPGITEGNQSYYTGNSFSVPHSAQQSLHGTPANPEQLPASIQEVNAPASSGVTSNSLLSRSVVNSQVTVAPTRNGTGGVIPLAEAIKQISFLEFLQRFGVSIAPPQPPQPPVSNSLLEAAVQTTTPCNVSQDLSTQTSYHSDTLSCDVAVQTSFFGAPTLSLDAAAQTITPSTLSQHVSTQMGSRSASSFSVDASVQITAHSAVLIDAATQLNLTDFLIGWIYSDRPVDRRHPFCQSPPPILGAHVAPLPPPGLEQPAPHHTTHKHTRRHTPPTHGERRQREKREDEREKKKKKKKRGEGDKRREKRRRRKRKKKKRHVRGETRQEKREEKRREERSEEKRREERRR